MSSDLISGSFPRLCFTTPSTSNWAAGKRRRAMSRVHSEEEDRVLLEEGTAGHVMLLTTPSAVTPPVETERTHVPRPRGERSPAAQVDPMVRPRSGSSLEEDRRRGRNGRGASDRNGVVVSGEAAAEEEEEEECGRERLKRHRVAMAGRVWIPETWGQEELLKDWIDCAAVDRALVPSGLVPAREALVEECRRADPGGAFRIESSCLSA